MDFFEDCGIVLKPAGPNTLGYPTSRTHRCSVFSDLCPF
ncbi:hypothetical protein GDO81_015947 [Engystomops pustulosus]|uniref:Uncharacterized protein n=1 Tax=Engystomops pustulosus TaxID=76066 RepID=A0AAV7APK6_ENGPU|nr:hypothetical protein GDO81_015947 [Engystomops pustulosus]